MMAKTAALADVKESIKQFLNKWCPPDRADEFMDDLYGLMEAIMTGVVVYLHHGITPGKKGVGGNG